MDYKLSAWSLRAVVFCCCAVLFSCGGSKDKSTAPPPLSANVSISGKVSYDFVPHNSNGLGLNYSATTTKPGRGLSIELLDANNVVLATATSDNTGHYSAEIQRDAMVKVRVKAQLLKTQSPGWDFKVIDNTSDDALYVMEGSLTAATEATAVRNLHAGSGWTGAGYTEPRVAAPFAILDAVLLAAQRMNAAANSKDFPALEIAWSSKNNTANGDTTLGEIGTSFFSGTRLYILGDENNDTDEYDRNVVLHEFGHYVEAHFSRSDSIGGDHPLNAKVDFRVAMSEAVASAFSAMMLDEPVYSDTNGSEQKAGFVVNVSRNDHAIRGWYSEASILSVLYNFYTSSNGKTARDFTPVFSVLSSDSFVASSAMTSIFTFYDALKDQQPSQVITFSELLMEQNIQATDAFATDETNDGGYAANLPVYKILADDTTPTTVCNTNRFGTYNKLGVTQFLRIDVASAATYRISVQETSADSGDSDPDIYLHRKGQLVGLGESSLVDEETLEQFLQQDTYVIEVVDFRLADSQSNDEITACFNVSAQRID